MIEVLRFPVTKFAGVVFIQRFDSNYARTKAILSGTAQGLRELCGTATLKNVFITTHRRDDDKPGAEQKLTLELSPGGLLYPLIEQGVQVYHSTGESDSNLGVLRIILEDWMAEKYKQLDKRMQDVVDMKVEKLRRELEERPQQEVDGFKKRIAEMQSKEESTRKQFYQELEEQMEQKRRAREEADGFRKRIAEMQPKLEEDQDRSGKAPAT